MIKNISHSHPYILGSEYMDAVQTVAIKIGGASKTLKPFISLYKVNKKPLLLEKARALADSITRIQNFKTCIIPTQWIFEDCNTRFDKWFWMNCHIGVANMMFAIADFLGE